jgi:aspartyl-tRNA(Asn)/glutamyl-tRNA(Gln) amidotransferase subunit C
MPVDIDIAKVARLARLALDEEALARYGEQLGAILEHAERVQALATEGVPPTSHPLPMRNTFRPDVVTGPLNRDEVLAQAPDVEGPYFRIPPVLGEAPETARE